MLVKATLTSKGQLTVPKRVRDRLDLRSGSKVFFVIKEDRVEIASATRTILDWYGTLTPGEETDLGEVHKEVVATRAQEVMREGADD